MVETSPATIDVTETTSATVLVALIVEMPLLSTSGEYIEVVERRAANKGKYIAVFEGMKRND